MKRLAYILVMAFALGTGPCRVYAATSEPQPATLIFDSLKEDDRVEINDEVVPTTPLKRAGSKLLVAPGEYSIRVIKAKNREECIVRLQLEEESEATVTCGQERGVALASKR